MRLTGARKAPLPVAAVRSRQPQPSRPHTSLIRDRYRLSLFRKQATSTSRGLGTRQVRLRPNFLTPFTSVRLVDALLGLQSAHSVKSRFVTRASPEGTNVCASLRDTLMHRRRRASLPASLCFTHIHTHLFCLTAWAAPVHSGSPSTPPAGQPLRLSF